jgi:phage-related protein
MIETRESPTPKPLVWLHGEVKSPPFSFEARHEAGLLLRYLQDGEKLQMPHAEPLPVLGPRCGVLRVRDAGHSWRIVFRADPDAVVVLEVYPKKTRAMPAAVIERCRLRLQSYDAAVNAAKKKDR